MSSTAIYEMSISCSLSIRSISSSFDRLSLMLASEMFMFVGEESVGECT